MFSSRFLAASLAFAFTESWRMTSILLARASFSASPQSSFSGKQNGNETSHFHGDGRGGEERTHCCPDSGRFRPLVDLLVLMPEE